MRIESSKLYPPQGMKATSTLRPSASSPISVAEPSATTSPASTWSPSSTTGRWLMQVFWFECALGGGDVLAEVLQVLAVVEDAEEFLVLARPEQVRTQARAPTEHLPELGLRAHQL